MKKLIFSVIAVAAVVCACSVRGERSSEFVRVENGQFVRGEDTLSFVGTNFWYGPLIASEGRGGNRERLHKELDALKSMPFFMQLLNDGPGSIFAAIIHKDDLIIIAAVFESLNHCIVKGIYIFCFIVAGNDQGKFHRFNSQNVELSLL